MSKCVEGRREASLGASRDVAVLGCLAVLLSAQAANAREDLPPLAVPMGVTVQIPLMAGASPSVGRTSIPYQQRDIKLQYYADARGMALYTYDNDAPNKSSCHDACAKLWPPLIAERGAKGFGEWSLVKRKLGVRQWAYKGKPLYRFAKDSVIGEASGVAEPADESGSEQKAPAADAPGKPSSPWKLASYAMADLVAPVGMKVQEVPDANGEVLVDANGMTLYMSTSVPTPDRTCRAEQCGYFKPVAAALMARPMGDFNLVDRHDGIRQWTYQGRGLYRYQYDFVPGDAKGVGVDERWQAVVIRRFFLPPQVRIGDTVGLGKVLTDANGMALYRRCVSKSMVDTLPRGSAVSPEEGRVIGTRSCGPECMKTWIPLQAPANAKPSGFWEIVDRQGGGKQWSYKGYALYRYAADEKPGDINGSPRSEVFFSPTLEAATPAGLVAADIRADDMVALIWTYMYP